ncbi:MAG: flagellar hook-associated protein FlgK [Zoogloeaceae bacterium]|jgi:flagellar hook-associated protein 1 FlgK|nr:flagellar hook-associated protein FlgK [Zoogloeaceae bacterium]
MSLLSTGVSALNTAQLGLATTQHNIANVNTPGYSRQATMQATNFFVMTGAGAIGQGVHVNTVLRSYSDILTGQVQNAQSRSSELDAYYSMISRIDNLLADSNSGLSPVLTGFFKAVQDTAANPSLISARQAMVSAAETLMTRFHTLENRLSQLYDEVNTQMVDTVSQINDYSAQIAKLNERVIAYNGGGQPPNDLLDQRDQLVLELNKLVQVNTYLNDNGALNVFAGSGQQLVTDTQYVKLEARPSATDPERYVIAQKGSIVELPEDYLTGGTMGGLLSFRKEALDQAANAMGQVAVSLALTVNAQQALGQDLLGGVAGDANFITEFFRISAPKAIENSRNQGSGSIMSFSFDPAQMSSEGNFFTQVTASDYEVRFTAPDVYTITRLSDKQVVASGTADGVTPAQFDGLTLMLSAGHASGDSYLLEPTRETARNIKVSQEISGDVRRIAAAMPIRTDAGVANTGAAKISAGEVVSSGYAIPNPPLVITYDGTSNQLTLSGTASSVLVNGAPATFPLTYNSGDEITIDGFRFTITGAPADGDTFTLEANLGGTADSRNIVKIGALQTALTTSGDTQAGTATFQAAYAQLVSEIGTLTKSALSNRDAQEVVLRQATEARDSVAGVNLDEEAANLIKYQQSYQAAARMMNTVSVLFDTLISIGR